MDVTDLMRRTARFNADAICTIAGSTRLTFAEQWQRGCRMANALIEAGLEPGDRVGVLEDNSVEAADFFLGAAIANVVRVPLYPRNARESHEHMLGHTDCRTVVVSSNLAAELDNITDAVPSLEQVIVRDDGYEDWLASYSSDDPLISADPDDNYIIRHTGGTTGRSKGVAYTHRTWLAAGRDWTYGFPPIEPGDRCLHVGPISHGSGYLYVPVFLSGGCNVLLDHFDPAGTLDVMESERISYMFAVPTMLNALVREPGAADRDWSHLKVLQIAAAPIADETALLGREVFGPVLYQLYGQTEALPVVAMGPNQWFAEIEGSSPLRAAGLPLPFADLKILDPETQEELPLGAEGEIAARCDGQMVGFWNDPEATAQRTHEGFVLTGDIGRLDTNGYLYVVDRKDDMVISGGYNIWPAELENALTDHPAVIEAAVFGIPSERWGETPCAHVAVDGTTPVTEDELAQLCADRLGSYKKPGRVVISTEPLPKSPVGKILRRELREPYWEGHDRRVSGN
ncbi:MAG: acyl-CoA synthetase (AMP-forming)/AMP-acid ligase II [Acidimicrobiales bacterium]|jgi:acyl-CoA synthetase (AMP-forming)/AMP-acid ligase II